MYLGGNRRWVPPYASDNYIAHASLNWTGGGEG